MPLSARAEPVEAAWHPRLAAARDTLEGRGRAELVDEGFALDGLTAHTFLDMRYAGQSYELSIPTASLAPAGFLPTFHAAHRERYGHSDASRAVEIVTLRVKLMLPATVGATGPSPLRGSARRTPPARREVWFGDKPVATAIYDRSRLEPGASLRGPAVVVQMDSTTAVPPGWRGEVDAVRNLILEPTQ